MQHLYLLILMSLNSILIAMDSGDSKDPLVDKHQSRSFEQVSSLSSLNTKPVSPSTSDDELKILAQKIEQETITLSEHISLLRKDFIIGNTRNLEKKLQSFSIRRLAEIVQETGKCKDAEHMFITKSAFNALVGLYHRRRFDIETELKGFPESIKLHLIRCILKQSVYTNPDKISYDDFTLSQAYAALAIYNTIYDRKKVDINNNLTFHRLHKIMLQAQSYNQEQGFNSGCVIS